MMRQSIPSSDDSLRPKNEHRRTRLNATGSDGQLAHW
jgi:hypothetical protein